MNKKFTKLIAALALLTFLAVPMGMRGQTKATVTDNMTASALAATGTSYTAFSNVSLTSDAVYAGKSALNNNANIQLRSSGSDCGIVTTVSGGKIKSITINVASGSNTIDVYGKNTAYTGAAQLYNSTNQGTKLGSVSSTGTITVSGDYEYVGVRSYNGAVYISSISFVWETASSTATATTVTIDDSGITNTDVYVNTAAGSLSATVTENVNNTTISGATVTWSSSDTNVATVGENGAITLVAAGTTTITASYGGQSGVYGSSSAIYELTVTNSEPYVQPTTIEIVPNYTFWGKTGQFSGSTYDELNGSQDNVSLHWTRGEGSTYANLSAMRFYKDNDLTFTAPEGYEIKSIVITFTDVKNDLIFSPEGYSLSESTGTWTGSSETVTMSRPSNADSYAQISKFTITIGLPIPTYTLSVSSLDHVEMAVSSGNEFLFEGEDDALVREGAQVTLSVIAESDYQMSSLMVDGDEKIQDVDETGAYSFAMPSHDVTITATATPLPRYTVSFTTNGNADGTMEVVQGQALGTLPSATASYIPEGYTFMGWYNGDYEVSNVAPVFITASFVPTADVTLKAVFAEVSGSTSVGTLTESEITANLTNTVCAYGTEKTYNDSNDGITWTVSCYTDQANRKWLQLKNDATAYIKVTAPNTITRVDVTISSGTNSSGGINDITKHTAFSETGVIYLNTNAANAANANHVGSTSGSDVSNYSATIVPEGNYSTLYIQTNPGSRIWGITVTSGSASYSNYRTSMSESYTLTINAHTTNGGWYLIASPVAVNPVDAGMITDNLTGDDLTPETSTYELYRFDNTNDSEWRNYRNQHFDLEPGTGYLYASKEGGEFTLTGTPYSGDGEFTLVSGDGNTGSHTNWNLVGNPYDGEAVISCDYYAMNQGGTDVEPVTDEVNVPAMTGVFVEYDATSNPFVMFEPATDASTSQVNNDKFILNVSQNRGNVIDRAIVRMGEGKQLPKFQLFENSAKIYIPQNGKDYAIVSTEAQGEMPVNFKAKENGTYTLSVDAENVEMNYLHLIDNMTGMDVDLLQTPSYTFEATTRDYESRFRVVFAANNNNEDGPSTGSGTFAFYSNGNLIINNAGEATLQVIDLTGRILSSETVNGSVSTTINAVPGVYMLRLINGENVNVQKIVVR